MKPMTWLAEEAGRLDTAVRSSTPLSSSKAKKAILTGKVRVGDARVQDPATWVPKGQALSLDMAAPNPARVNPFGIKLVYRDDDVLVINKPAGLAAAPLPNDDRDTALTGANRLCRNGPRAKVVHRLDMQTSGLMLFARGVPAARAIRIAMDNHEVKRTYRCVVKGVPNARAAMISSMMIKDAGDGRRGSRRGTLRTRSIDDPDPGPMPGGGKLAITRFKVFHRAEGRAAVEVELATGRTHQIRIHMAEIGCPILGESVYARNTDAPRQALHAAFLAFAHPRTREPLRFECPWPEDLRSVTPIGRDW